VEARRLRVALFGVEHWHAEMHLHAFESAGGELVALASTDQELAASFAPHVTCPRTSTLSETLAQNPDFVMIMGTPQDMLEAALELANGTVAFGVEKPIGRSASEMLPLVTAVEKSGLFATVPLVNRYSRLWESLPRGATDDLNGGPWHAQFKIINGPPKRYRDWGVSWVLDPTAFGGGAMRNLGIHAADAFLQLCGDRHYEIAAAIQQDGWFGERVEDYGAAILTTENGCSAIIEAGYTYPGDAPGSDFEWRVASRGSFVLDRDSTLTIVRASDNEIHELQNIPQARRYDEFGQDVIARLAAGSAPKVTLRDAFRAMQLVDEFYEAATASGRRRNS